MPIKNLLLVFSIIFMSGCESKKQIDLGLSNIKPQDKACKIVSNIRSDGQNYRFIFDKDKLINIMGFNDFDTFVYEGNVIKKAFHSKTKNAEILFDFDSKGLLKKVTFEGRDSQGKFFSYPTVITHNVINKIEKLVLSWPTFSAPVETKFTYDINGNVKYISAFLDNQWLTVLENTEYDDKQSPYKNQQLGQIMSYYLVYSVLSGGNNFTYFINNNNVKSSITLNNRDRVTSNFVYKYNASGFPTDVDYTRTINNRPSSQSEKFTYDCDI